MMQFVLQRGMLNPRTFVWIIAVAVVVMVSVMCFRVLSSVFKVEGVCSTLFFVQYILVQNIDYQQFTVFLWHWQAIILTIIQCIIFIDGGMWMICLLWKTKKETFCGMWNLFSVFLWIKEDHILGFLNFHNIFSHYSNERIEHGGFMPGLKPEFQPDSKGGHSVLTRNV